MIDKVYKCSRCSGDVVPGKNGVILGLSSSPDGNPNGAIMDTIEVVHYLEFCGSPEVKVSFPSLGPLED